MNEIIQENKIQCKICGLLFYSLSKHLSTHKISIKDYYDKFYKKENEGVCLLCGKITQFESIKRGYSKHCSLTCAYKSSYRNSKLVKNDTLQKRINTCREKFKVDNVFSLDETKKKIIETNMKTLGVPYNQQSGVVRQKTKKTNLIKFDNEESLASPIVRDKIYKTNYRKYGFKTASQTKQGRLISRNNMLSKLKEVKNLTLDEIRYQLMGITESKFIRLLKKYLIHENVIFQYPIIGYYIDCYFPELNMAIEFDEPHHFCNGILHQSDIDRQDEIQKTLGCNFVRITKIDFLNNPTFCVENLIFYINQRKSEHARLRI